LDLNNHHGIGRLLHTGGLLSTQDFGNANRHAQYPIVIDRSL
jgi:hypothetical protein